MKHVSQEFHFLFSCEFILHEITCKICVKFMWKYFAWNSCKIHLNFTWNFYLNFHFYCSFQVKMFGWISHGDILHVQMTCRSYFNGKFQTFKFHLIFWCVHSQYEVKGFNFNEEWLNKCNTVFVLWICMCNNSIILLLFRISFVSACYTRKRWGRMYYSSPSTSI